MTSSPKASTDLSLESGPSPESLRRMRRSHTKDENQLREQLKDGALFQRTVRRSQTRPQTEMAPDVTRLQSLSPELQSIENSDVAF